MRLCFHALEHVRRRRHASGKHQQLVDRFALLCTSVLVKEVFEVRGRVTRRKQRAAAHAARLGCLLALRGSWVPAGVRVSTFGLDHHSQNLNFVSSLALAMIRLLLSWL